MLILWINTLYYVWWILIVSTLLNFVGKNNAKGAQENFGVMDMSYILIRVVVVWVSLSKIIELNIKIGAFSVQLLSRVQLFATPWITASRASLCITNSRSSLRFTSIKSVMPSSHLILGHALFLLPLIPPSIRVFSSESTLHRRWPKYWSFSFGIIRSKEHPGLISFRMDWLDLLAVQGTLKSLLQRNSSKASILRHSAFFTVTLTSIHDPWENHSLD